MKLTARKTRSNIGRRLDRVNQRIDKISPKALKKFRELTPKDQGNARRKTKLQSNNTIVADYPYAVRLNEGWSKQAPKGMVEPFLKWLRAQTRIILKRK